MPRAITGIKPTGRPHLGNYLGMIRPALDLSRSREIEMLFFIADYHALTGTREPAQLRHDVLDIAATLVAFGLDTERTVLYRQSDLPEVCELTWILGCVTPKGLLNRAHAYKAATAANAALGKEADDGVNAGLFSYPVLMAADILIHRAQGVPVGRDQRQHVEIARDLAESFNRAYGPVLVLPEPIIDERVMTVPGVDGRKMSKSYGNQIGLSASPDEIRRRVSRIVTDSRSPAEPKEPDTILSLYRSVAPDADALDLERRYREGGVGYAEAKALLTGAIEELLAPARQRHAELLADPAVLREILARGAARARESAAAALQAVRAATGMGWS
jgi:tryptophanyl-tRNA synthetase